MEFLKSILIGQSSAAYSAHNRDGHIDAQLLVIQICSRGGKVFQRSIPSENVVPDCLQYSPIFRGKGPSHRVQSLFWLFRQKVRAWPYWRGEPFEVLKLKEIASNFSLFLIRFAIFRRILDAEMKDGTRVGVGLKAKQKEKEPVSLHAGKSVCNLKCLSWPLFIKN